MRSVSIDKNTNAHSGADNGEWREVNVLGVRGNVGMSDNSSWSARGSKGE